MALAELTRLKISAGIELRPKEQRYLKIAYLMHSRVKFGLKSGRLPQPS